MGHQPLGEAKIKQGIQNKDLLSDDENISNASDSSNAKTLELVDDETKDLFLLNESNEVEELMDNEFGLFI
jgi:hypothetical protein